MSAPVKLIALNLPPAAILVASAHAGMLDQFVADPWLGIPCAVILGWYALAVALLGARVRRWADRVADDLVLLGMLGTAIGMIVALSGLRIEDLAQIEGFLDAILWVLTGTGVALYTTAIGIATSFYYGWQRDLVE